MSFDQDMEVSKRMIALRVSNDHSDRGWYLISTIFSSIVEVYRLFKAHQL